MKRVMKEDKTAMHGDIFMIISAPMLHTKNRRVFFLIVSDQGSVAEMLLSLCRSAMQ